LNLNINRNILKTYLLNNFNGYQYWVDYYESRVGLKWAETVRSVFTSQ